MLTGLLKNIRNRKGKIIAGVIIILFFMFLYFVFVIGFENTYSLILGKFSNSAFNVLLRSIFLGLPFLGFKATR